MKANIGITGTGSLIGQAIIKCVRQSSLRDRCRMIGFDYFPDTVGSYWVAENELLPDLLSRDVTSDQWVDRLIEAIRRHDLEVLFCGVDFELPVLAAARPRIERETGCQVLVSDPDVVEIADDKYQTFTFLESHALTRPETVLASEIDSADLTYPCILKPRRGARSRGVFRVADSGEVRRRLMGGDPAAFVLQELVGDDRTEYSCGVVCLDGRLEQMISLRRDLKEGNTANAYFDGAVPPQIAPYLEKVVDALRPRGACNFQLRLDRGGTPKIFEINARHSGTTYMRALFGMNEVECILRSLSGLPPAETTLRFGLVKRFYDELFLPAPEAA